MTDQELKTEIKKAIVMLQEETWNPDDFTARMLQLFGEQNYRQAFERYMGNVLEMRRLQDKYFSGDKSVMGKCKAAESMVQKLTVANAKKMGITNLSDLLKKYTQQSIFGND